MTSAKQDLSVWFVAVGVVVLISALTSAMLWKHTIRLRDRVNELRVQARSCGRATSPPRKRAHPIKTKRHLEPTRSSPAQDKVSPERLYIGDNGVVLPKRFKTQILDLIHTDGTITSLQAGNRRHVLTPGKVTVINVWATFCTPCKKELPGFKKLFEQHKSNWKSSVSFVPIQLARSGDPRKAYKKYGRDMPPSLWFADRLDGVLESLEKPGKGEQQLYYGRLPVTLVLDCNQRVRWARFAALKKDQFDDLANTINRLLDERTQRKCFREWCGNGVCSRREDAKLCPDDCGAQVTAPSPAGKSPPSTPKREPSIELLEETQSDDSQVIDQVEEPVPSCVHDGVCDPEKGESEESCCLDCLCKTELDKCILDEGRWRCIPQLLISGKDEA